MDILQEQFWPNAQHHFGRRDTERVFQQMLPRLDEVSDLVHLCKDEVVAGECKSFVENAADSYSV